MNKNLEDKIPKGITEGKQIRLWSRCCKHGGGKNGDLFLKVMIQHDDNIRLEGTDVYRRSISPLGSRFR